MSNQHKNVRVYIEKKFQSQENTKRPVLESDTGGKKDGNYGDNSAYQKSNSKSYKPQKKSDSGPRSLIDLNTDISPDRHGKFHESIQKKSTVKEQVINPHNVREEPLRTEPNLEEVGDDFDDFDNQYERGFTRKQTMAQRDLEESKKEFMRSMEEDSFRNRYQSMPSNKQQTHHWDELEALTAKKHSEGEKDYRFKGIAIERNWSLGEATRLTPSGVETPQSSHSERARFHNVQDERSPLDQPFPKSFKRKTIQPFFAPNPLYPEGPQGQPRIGMGMESYHGGPFAGAFAPPPGLAPSQTLEGNPLEDFKNFANEVVKLKGSFFRPFGILTKSTSQEKWFYIDQSGLVQGPFSSEEMDTWFNQDYFADELPISCNDPVNFKSLKTYKDLAIKQAYEMYFPEKAKVANTFPVQATPPPPGINPAMNVAYPFSGIQNKIGASGAYQASLSYPIQEAGPGYYHPGPMIPLLGADMRALEENFDASLSRAFPSSLDPPPVPTSTTPIFQPGVFLPLGENPIPDISFAPDQPFGYNRFSTSEGQEESRKTSQNEKRERENADS